METADLKNRHHRVHIVVATIVACAAVTLMFPALVLHPWNVVPNLGADGGKNIYTYLYHVLYGHGMWYTGMNFPYGEHIVYTDGQPLLSVSLAGIGGIGVSTALGVMWWLVAASQVLGILFLYKILRCFGVSFLFSLVFAVLIGLFSPQIFRIQGHYGLSYSCVIPMLFYWTLQYNGTGKWNYASYVFVLGIVSGLLHPYFSGVTFLWVAFYGLAYFLTGHSPLKARLTHVLPPVFAGAGVMLFFAALLHFTDPVVDRPLTPYGMTTYCATGGMLVSSAFSPIWIILQHLFTFAKAHDGGEGYCYLGFTTLITCCWALVSTLRTFKKRRVTNSADTADFKMWLVLALFALLLGMGVPFVWHMEWLTDYLTFMRQFRTLGRFTWMFYYILSVFAATYLYRTFKELKTTRKYLATAIMVTAVTVWAVELSGYYRYQHDAMKNVASNCDELRGTAGRDWNLFFTHNNLKTNDFQAILALKFFAIGSDKIWLGEDAYAYGIEKSGIASLQLHLPIMDIMMARSSWSQTQNQVKTAGGPYVGKPVLAMLPSAKPLLLLVVKGTPLDPDEQYLVDHSEPLGEFSGCTVMKCLPQSIMAIDVKNRDEVVAFARTMNAPDSCLKYDGIYIVQHFDKTTPFCTGFAGGSGQAAIKKHDTVVYEGPFSPKYDNQLYELSCWFRLPGNNYKSPYFKIEMLDVAGNVTREHDALTKESKDSRGLWFRQGTYFEVPIQCKRLRLRLINDGEDSYEAMDELLVRPAGSVVVSKLASGVVMANNHPLTP